MKDKLAQSIQERNRDTLNIYLRDVSSMPLLDRDEERGIINCIEEERKKIAEVVLRTSQAVTEVMHVEKLTFADMITFTITPEQMMVTAVPLMTSINLMLRQAGHRSTIGKVTMMEIMVPGHHNWFIMRKIPMVTYLLKLTVWM